MLLEPTQPLSSFPPLADRGELPELLNALHLKGVGLEMGVDEGKFSQLLLDKTKLELLVSLDYWRHQSSYDAAYKRLRPYAQRSCLIKTWSVIGLTLFPDNFFDFVYPSCGVKTPTFL